MREARRLVCAGAVLLLAAACVSVAPPDAGQTAVASPTSTGDPGPTAGASSTPGAPPAPTAAASGTVIFSDDFESATRYLSDSATRGLGSAEYTDGVFRVTSESQTSANYVAGGTVSPCLGPDCREADVLHEDLATVSVAVDARQTAGSAQGWYGIACGYEGTGVLGGFIGLTISSDGRHYAIARNFNPGIDAFPAALGGAVRGDAAPSIQVGLDTVNSLRADCGRERSTLLVNGVAVASAETSPPEEPDAKMGVALIAAAGMDEPITVEFDNLVVSELAAEPAPAPETQLVFSDPMTDDHGYWTTGRVALTTTEITPDGMHVDFSQANSWSTAVPSIISPGVDSITEVTFSMDADLGGVVGLLCRGQQTNQYASYLYIDEFGDAYTWLSLFNRSDEPVLLTDFTLVDALVAETRTPITLRLDCAGSSLTGYVNGTRYVSAEDTTISAAGYTGLYMESLPEPAQAAYLFSDFQVSRP